LVIGHDRGGLAVDDVAAFAKELGWPIVAEDPLSFPEALSHASIFLTSQVITDELAPDTAVVIGRTTLSRSINRFIATARKTIVIDPRIITVDTDRVADQKFAGLPKVEVPLADTEYADRWKKYSVRAAKKIGEMTQWSEALVAREIGSGLTSGQSLFIASSRPIRDIEGFASARSGIETFANRGLAGIDGNISTALGIAATRKETVAVLGDLSFLHDLTGLIHQEDINLKIIVIDNNGGGIFSTLPHRGVSGFETIFGTPHNLDIKKIAESFGLSTASVKNQTELQAELRKQVKGLSLLVVAVPDRESNADHLKAIYDSMSSI
jgi:2-succinyl-5-enolpyruvyl-6-hydroxy-3-cyclohexene-1-carboxylate synthase